MGLSNIQRARRADGTFPPLAGGDGLEDPAAVVDPEPEPAGTPEPEATQQQIDWEKRFHDTEASFTRVSQEAAELRQRAQLIDDLQSDDPQRVKQAADALGIAYEDPDPPSPDQELTQQVQELAAWRAEQQQQADYTAYRGMVDPQLTEMGVPAGLTDWVAERALQLPPVNGPTGPQPNLKAAFAEIEQLAPSFAQLKATQAAIAEARKKQPKPPAPPATRAGVEGIEIPASTHQARTQRMLARINDGG